MSIPWLESDDLFVKVQLYLSADDPTYFHSPTLMKKRQTFYCYVFADKEDETG